MVFSGVYSAKPLKGMTAFVLRKHDYKKLESEMCKRARQVLGEWTVQKREEVKVDMGEQVGRKGRASQKSKQRSDERNEDSNCGNSAENT